MEYFRRNIRSQVSRPLVDLKDATFGFQEHNNNRGKSQVGVVNID